MVDNISNEKINVKQIYIKGLCWIDVKDTHFSFRFQGIPKNQHFTISYNSPNGHIDLHISKNISTLEPNNKPKITIFKADKKHFIEDSEKILQALLINILIKIDDETLNKYEQLSFVTFSDFENNNEFEILNKRLLEDFKNLIRIRNKSRAEIKGDFIEPIESFSQSAEIINLVETSIKKFNKSEIKNHGYLFKEEDYIPIFFINGIWYELKRNIKLAHLLSPILPHVIIKKIEWKIKRSIIHLKSLNSYQDALKFNNPIKIYKRGTFKNIQMEKDKKYYGEISLNPKMNDKCFAVIELKNNQIQIETNLIKARTEYGVKLIYGLITELGHITFLDCKVQYIQSGIANARIYFPKYTFVSAHHFINISNLNTNQFNIENSIIVDWVSQIHIYNYQEKKLEKEDDVTIPIEIQSKKLNIEIVRTTNYKANHKEFILNNVGLLKFTTQNNIKIIDAIDYYNIIQKIFHFIYSGSKQFSNFSFKCLGCGEWIDLYYKDLLYNNSDTSYINFDYNTIKEEMFKIVSGIFSDEELLFCIDKLMENLTTNKQSHNKRFTNSISAFEAYGKTYLKRKNTKLNGFLQSCKHLILNITEQSEKEFNPFIQKIIRSRDYYIHSNKDQFNIFSEFELLYISFLLDYTIGHELLKKMEVSEKILEIVIQQAKSVFIHMQGVNKMLNKDPLFDEEL